MSERGKTRGARRKLRLWHVGAALLCLSILAFVGFRLLVRAKLASRIEAIHAAGHPVTMAQLNDWYTLPAGGVNAADYIIGAMTFIRPPTGAAREQLPLLGKPDLPPRTQPLDDDMTSLIGEFLDDNARATETLIQAAALGPARYPIDFSDNAGYRVPHLTELNTAARLLHLKAVLDAERAEGQPAAEAAIAVLGLGQSLVREPLFISQLVRQGCQSRAVVILERILNRTELDADCLKRLEQALAAAHDPNALERGLIGERCATLHAFARPIELTRMSDSEGPSVAYLEMLRGLGLLDLAEIQCVDLLDRQIAVLRLPVHERAPAVAAIERDIAQMRKKTRRMGGHLPSFHRAITREVETMAEFLTARAAIAVERYRLTTGRLPDRLADLVPTYLHDVPQDPFDARPLRYKRLETGYVVYSVGSDENDNGGKERPHTRGAPSEPPYDITFTVERPLR